METETPDALTLVLAIIFMVSGIYAVLGNCVLYLMLVGRVTAGRWLSMLIPVVVYFSARRLMRTRSLDFLATTVALAFAVLFVVTLLLFARGFFNGVE